MSAEIMARIHNRFDIEVIDTRTGNVRQNAKAENVVCNGFWSTRAANSNVIMSNIVFGSGSGTPTETDSALFTFVGTKDIRSTKSYNFADGVGSLSVHCTISETEYAGSTLSEVGLAYSNNLLFSHAILKDMNGNPITIAKTDTDIINIYATWFVHVVPELTGIVHLEKYTTECGLFTWLCGGKSLIAGNIDDTGFPCMHGNVSRDFPPLNADNIGALNFNVSFNASSKTLTLSRRLGIGEGNVTNGIKYVYFTCGYRQSSTLHYLTNLILPVGSFTGLEGYNITNESIGTGDGSRTSFDARFDVHSDFVLKVNGETVTTGFTRDGRTVTFASAPEVGAVVTADYFTDTIPKDSDHVYDLTVTISFGEYVPE